MWVQSYISIIENEMAAKYADRGTKSITNPKINNIFANDIKIPIHKTNSSIWQNR